MKKLNEQQKSDLYIYCPSIDTVMEKNLKPTMDFELTFEDGSVQPISLYAIPKPYVREETISQNVMECINLSLCNGHYVVKARLVMRHKRRISNMKARMRGGQFVIATS